MRLYLVDPRHNPSQRCLAPTPDDVHRMSDATPSHGRVKGCARFALKPQYLVNVPPHKESRA